MRIGEVVADSHRAHGGARLQVVARLQLAAALAEGDCPGQRVRYVFKLQKKVLPKKPRGWSVADDDGDDEESETGPTLAQPIDTRKLVQDISREIKKTFREEIGNLESSLEFLSDQICTIEQSIRNQDKAIKDLEHKNQDLLNKNKNLELRVSVLEQGMKNFEQKALASTLEIAGLPDFPIKDVSKIVETTASKLNLETSGIQSSQRMPGSKDKAGTILVEMKTKAHQKQWIDASKEKYLTVGLLFPDAPQEKAENRVYIREALTKNLKTLLYNAKTQLNKSFQFIWCKDGKNIEPGSGQHMLTRVCNSGLTSEMQQPTLEPRGPAQSALYDDTACNTWRGI
ncbi:unnamed protein product [Plutella xylostella]|uniref:(diamondback moth) hypothetical protein n=1 Tax=Plutella xylostella TaxID=51655 RepID=A0A8S4GDP4_PLUXY|nr:unnamed protein product [Plutella xylostella]